MPNTAFHAFIYLNCDDSFIWNLILRGFPCVGLVMCKPLFWFPATIIAPNTSFIHFKLNALYPCIEVQMFHLAVPSFRKRLQKQMVLMIL